MFTKILFILAVFCHFSFTASQEEATTVDYGELNDAFESFLLEALTSNFTTWLSHRDPLPVIPESVRFEDQNSVEFLEIKNQVMSGHSESTSDMFFITPFLGNNQFGVGRNVLNDGDFLTFEGTYNASGFIRMYEPSPHNITFKGQGRWIIKSSMVAEGVSYGNFSMDSNGFIDVSQSSNVWSFSKEWSYLSFEGIEIEDHGGSENNEELKVEAIDILAKLYGEFLSGPYFPELQEYNPTRRLLMIYIPELLQTKTLEDIVSDYERPPKNTPITDAPAPSGSSNLIVANFLWLLIISQF